MCGSRAVSVNRYRASAVSCSLCEVFRQQQTVGVTPSHGNAYVTCTGI